MGLDRTIAAITERIQKRSEKTRSNYLEQIKKAAENRPRRSFLGCANQAHGFAACGAVDKAQLKDDVVPNIGIITAYNDMLSAHQPFGAFPDIIKQAARDAGGVAVIAGGVPAMCDGVTQGYTGMELSLFSRDVIALATAVGLSHDTFDGALYLGVCDKIVPGLVIGALTFGHLPAIFVPAGPMTSGLPNDEKAKARQLFAEGKISRKELLDYESQSYHGPGTCTFYGTANSNQMMMEIMGLHLPGASFVNPNTPLRDALTREATTRLLELTALGQSYLPVGEMIDERSFVNAIVGLNATGGSTNHTIHLIAMAAAAGIQLTWHDIAEISAIVPLIARVYPNGLADVNHFHAAGGMGYLIKELLAAGLLHEDVQTVAGLGLHHYAIEPKLSASGHVVREKAPDVSGDDKVLSTVQKPFQNEGGIRVLDGNIGAAIIKVSAVKPERWVIEAPAKVFNSQAALQEAFQQGQLDEQDFIAVIRYQGPKANGMPELHKLMTVLGILQDRGQKVALITDGRMSGASGKVPSAIHVTPETLDNDVLAKLCDGDMIRLDAQKGTLELLVDASVIASRPIQHPDLSMNEHGTGRELFHAFRHLVSRADLGASVVIKKVW